MYKVFINDTPLILASEDEEVNLDSTHKTIGFKGKKKLEKLIYAIRDSKKHPAVFVRHYDLDDLFYALKRITKSVPAAGGVVWNEYAQVLFIFRKGKWDLPKGKLDKGEHPREASIREVQEECGLEQVELTEFAGSTYHIYKQGGELCLKKTYWYHMKSISAVELVPQLEEDITAVEWVSVGDIPEKLNNAYSAIKELAGQVILHHKFE